MKEAIYKKKGLELNNVKQNTPLDKWFYEMIQKDEDKLTIRDVSHMLRQEVYLDIAIPIAWRYIINNPFCGEMYEGQLIELLTRVFSTKPCLKQADFYLAFEQNVKQRYEIHVWDNDYDKEEYEKLLVEFRKLFT